MKRSNSSKKSLASKSKKQKVLKSLKEPSIDELLQNLRIENDNISFDEFYQNRINKYKIITSNNIILSNECLITSNNTIKLNTTKQNIILRKIIGSGATSYIFSADANYDNGKKIDIIFKFLSYGENEINIMNKMTNYVLEKKTPHFMINYISRYNCDEIKKIEENIDNNIKENISDINKFSVSKTPQDEKIKHYSLIIMEKLDGDVSKLFQEQINENIKKNIELQMYIALLSFIILSKTIHEDAQFKNFFYKKIKADDKYLHYKIIYKNKLEKNIYIKNYGYLIIIADYGFSKKLKEYEGIITRDKQKKLLVSDFDFIHNDYTELTNMKRDETITEEDFFNFIIKKYKDNIKDNVEDNKILNANNPYEINFYNYYYK
jgi:hypothetical protein